MLFSECHMLISNMFLFVHAFVLGMKHSSHCRDDGACIFETKLKALGTSS